MPRPPDVGNCSEAPGTICLFQVFFAVPWPEVAEWDDARLQTLVTAAQPNLVTPKQVAIQYRRVVGGEDEMGSVPTHRRIMELGYQEPHQLGMQIVVQFVQHDDVTTGQGVEPRSRQR